MLSVPGDDFTFYALLAGALATAGVAGWQIHKHRRGETKTRPRRTNEKLLGIDRPDPVDITAILRLLLAPAALTAVAIIYANSPESSIRWVGVGIAALGVLQALISTVQLALGRGATAEKPAPAEFEFDNFLDNPWVKALGGLALAALALLMAF